MNAFITKFEYVSYDNPIQVKFTAESAVGTFDSVASAPDTKTLNSVIASQIDTWLNEFKTEKHNVNVGTSSLILTKADIADLAVGEIPVDEIPASGEVK